jgi:cytochrome c553
MMEKPAGFFKATEMPNAAERDWLMQFVERSTGAMRFTVVYAFLVFALPALAQELLPTWAYPVAPKDYVPPADNGTVRHVPGSTKGYTLTDIRGLFFALDWLPEGHAPMPSIVAQGRKPNLRPCGTCHRPEGIGGPENASLAGLPSAYLLRQIEDFRTGARTTGVKERAHVFRMISAIKELTEDEIEQVVAYYAAMTLPARVKVVESETVPTTYVPNWYYTSKLDGKTEPLGDRIIEIPDDEENFVNRDYRVTFTAYVPPGSVARGEQLVAGREAERVPACATCHGDGLKGIDSIPPIAGRSPSMIVRQLYEFKYGIRHGSMAEPMKANASQMTIKDMIAIAAYLATLTP